jgi:hypothetical protein
MQHKQGKEINYPVVWKGRLRRAETKILNGRKLAKTDQNCCKKTENIVLFKLN